MSFIDDLKQKAKQKPQRIVLPESQDPRMLDACHTILSEGIAEVILIGDEAKLKSLAKQSIDGAHFVDPAKFERLSDYEQAFYEMRKKKGMELEQARSFMQNPMYFAVMMVKMGDADGMVAGAVESSANVLRPALQILKTAPGTKLVSAFFLMDVPDCSYGDDGVFIFSDCGLNENPDADQLSEIAISSARSYESLLGREARVAMLSYSSFGSAKSELVEKVQEATRLAKEKAPELYLDGEMQADAALVESVAKMKAPDSPVAGRANVLIFPDLNAGNIGYKLVQRLAKAEAYGPITQGIAGAINDLSRGCSADDIVGVVAITAVQAASRQA
ncbi:MAG: phosphate acetyltransferase [Eubacteriales bacterium]|nr:phosphate acetyltransferase [Eubacteriales bacterium]